MAKVSFIIPSWNSSKYLPACIKSIFDQSYENYEIIVIDNASQDNSPEILKNIQSNFEKIRVIYNTTNKGYCGAINQGYNLSTGEYIVFMNPDVVLSKYYLENAIKKIQLPYIGSIAAKLLRMNDHRIIDSTGLFIDPFRRAFDRGQLEIDHGQYEKLEYVFSAPGALAFHRRSMLEDIKIDNEILDEDFFAYYDDVDIGWRAQLAGWKCLYVPQAIAYHARGGENALRGAKKSSSSVTAKILAIRNRYLTILKNDSAINILSHLHYIIFYEIVRTSFLFIYSPYMLKGIFYSFKLLPKMIKKRRMIYKKRKVSHNYIRSFFKMRGKVNRGN